MTTETSRGGLEEMFPCDSMDEVKKVFGNDIAGRVETLSRQSDSSLKSSLRQALREHFAAMAHAAKTGMSVEIGADDDGPNPADWKSNRSARL